MILLPQTSWRARLIRGLIPLFLFLAIVFFIPVQTLLLEGIRVGGIKPDLGFILACVIGISCGYKPGLFMGLLLGGFQDFFSIGTFGPNIVLNGLTGLGIGLLERFFLYFSLNAHIFIVLGISVLHDLLGEIGLNGLLKGLQTLSLMMIGQALYNCVMVIGLLGILLRWSPFEGEQGVKNKFP